MFIIIGLEVWFVILLFDLIKVLKIELINKNIMNNDKCDLKKIIFKF